MPENNKDNCDKLAAKCVSSWDMDDLVNYAEEVMSVELQLDNDMFNQMWEAMGVDE